MVQTERKESTVPILSKGTWGFTLRKNGKHPGGWRGQLITGLCRGDGNHSVWVMTVSSVKWSELEMNLSLTASGAEDSTCGLGRLWMIMVVSEGQMGREGERERQREGRRGRESERDREKEGEGEVLFLPD